MAKIFILLSLIYLSTFSYANEASDLESFLTGIKLGSQQPLSCAENPQLCGVYIGQLLSAPTMDLVTVFTQHVTYDASMQLISGFQTSFGSVWGCISTILDVGSLAYDIYHFTTPGFQSESVAKKVSDVLNFTCTAQKTIFDFIFIMNTCGGKSELSMDLVMQNYATRQQEIDSALAIVQNCGQDYFQCGKSTGDIIKLLTQ